MSVLLSTETLSFPNRLLRHISVSGERLPWSEGARLRGEGGRVRRVVRDRKGGVCVRYTDKLTTKNNRHTYKRKIGSIDKSRVREHRYIER